MSDHDKALLIEEITKLLPKVARYNYQDFDALSFLYLFTVHVCDDVDEQEAAV